jgi:hypothetical protein
LWPDLPDLLAAARAQDRADAVVVRITALEQDEEAPEDLDLVGSAVQAPRTRSSVGKARSWLICL